MSEEEIKTIKCNDIEIPIEYLSNTNVIIPGNRYIQLQQENQRLKEILDDRCRTINALKSALQERTDERDKHSDKEYLYKSVIDEVREYVYRNEYCRFGHIDGSEADEIYKILDKANIKE